MKRLILNSSGFTLIELIIAFTVLAILSVVGVASFVDYSRSQAISADRQKLITVLNTAKANASSQLKRGNDCSGGVLNGYSVSIDTTDVDNETYSLNIECNPSQIVAPPLATYKLSKNIIFDTSDPVTKVVKVSYPLFTGKAVLYSDNFETVRTSPGTIILSGSGKTSKIIIDQTGIIK